MLVTFTSCFHAHSFGYWWLRHSSNIFWINCCIANAKILISRLYNQSQDGWKPVHSVVSAVPKLLYGTTTLAWKGACSAIPAGPPDGWAGGVSGWSTQRVQSLRLPIRVRQGWPFSGSTSKTYILSPNINYILSLYK